MLNVVLYEPEIPQNTGNIMRTCMAMNCRLHLIEPLGFYMDEKHLRRAGMDYRDELEWHVWPSWEAFCCENRGTYYYVTRYGHKDPSAFDYSEAEGDIYLIFGRESTGIPRTILQAHEDYCVRIPMVPQARSLNLANCVAICVYVVQQQRGFAGLSAEEVIKGADYLSRHDVT